MFDYSKIHFFSKDGYEVPHDIKKSCFFNADSSLEGGRKAVLYGLTSLDSSGNVSTKISKFESYDSGILFGDDVSTAVMYETLVPSNTKAISSADCSLIEIQVYNDKIDSNYDGKHYYGIDSVSLSKPIEIKEDVAFPSITFDGVLNFEPVSADLFETETVYVLKETLVDGVKNFTKITSSDVEDGRYKFLFLIDSSVEDEFRMFTVDQLSNELVFENSQYMTFTDDDETGYRINIAFSSKDEGVHEDKLYICLIDTQNNDEPYLLGTIKLHAETIGEDERYRTFFTNFGIPDPKDYIDIFKEAGTDEDLVDNDLLNRKSKELFLTYDNIFPYVGTYKALINAVTYLGYEDITFKEWYKNTSVIEGKPEYVSFDVAYKNEYSKNRINSLSLEERMSIKKLNWLTMKYKLNDEVFTTIDKESDIDESGDVPFIIKNEYTYRNDEVLLKLYALKNWLEKNIIAQNCRIIEVVGEGIYVERYAYNVYGNITQTYDFNSDLVISPYLKGTSEDRILKDGSAVISIGIKELDDFENKLGRRTLENLSENQFENIDDSELYIDLENSVVKAVSDGYDQDKALEGKHILINDSFIHPTDFDYVTVVANNSSSEYMFRSPYVGTNNLWIHDGEILFEPKNYKEDANSKEVVFSMLPEIYVETAYLRDPFVHWVDDSTSIIYSVERDADASNNVSFILKNWRTGETATFTDYPILKPTSKGSLKYTEYNYLGLPLFIMSNFSISGASIFDSSAEYVLDLKDGKFAFESSDVDTYLYLNFNYDSNSSEQEIEVNTTYINNLIKINQTVFDSDFIEKYKENPDTAFTYVDTFDISVNKTGYYDIRVYGYDRYNNVYGKRVQGYPEIIMESPNIEVIAEQENSNNTEDFYIFNEDGTLVDSGDITYEENPIFAPMYLINDVSVSDGSIYYKNISYAVDTPKSDDIVRFYNITDRFKMTSFTTPYTVERTGSALSNEYFNGYNNVNCVLFDTTFDNPIFECDASMQYDSEADTYKLSKLSDTGLINYLKGVDNPPHLYIRSKNKYLKEVTVDNSEDKTKLIIAKTDAVYQVGQKIKIVITDNGWSIEGIYTIDDISIENDSNILTLNTNICTDFFSNKATYNVSYPNIDFVNYKVDVESTEETISGDCLIDVTSKEMADHIDNTYSIGYRDFDIENAYSDWAEMPTDDLYSYSIPITLSNSTVILKVGESEYPIKNPSYYWIVYKQLDGKNHIKHYELYNDTLFLNIDEEGIYDVELWTYDEYGNLVNKTNKGSFKK